MRSVERLCGWEAGASLVSGRDRGKRRPCPRPRLSPHRHPAGKLTRTRESWGSKSRVGLLLWPWQSKPARTRNLMFPVVRDPAHVTWGPRRARRSPPASSRPQTYASRQRSRTTRGRAEEGSGARQRVRALPSAAPAPQRARLCVRDGSGSYPVWPSPPSSGKWAGAPDARAAMPRQCPKGLRGGLPATGHEGRAETLQTGSH